VDDLNSVRSSYLTHLLRLAVEDLFPGYFSLIMATGALSIAFHLLDLSGLAQLLLALNIAAYAILWFLTLCRLALFADKMLADLGDHARGPGFFTLVAGTCVLGTQLLLVGSAPTAAAYLWGAGIVLWVIVMYAFFPAVIVRARKPAFASGINGAWLIAAVATQSVAVLGAQLDFGVVARFFSLVMFLVGSMLYLSIITLIFYRLTFVRLTTVQFTPPYWINMGAVAITTLAGSTLILRGADWPMVQELMPFLKGFTLFFWATATWWIPLLFILMFWRHIICRHRLAYDPQYWGMVFPLAMYTTGTFQLAHALDVPFLLAVPRTFVVVASFAWAGTLAAAARHLWTKLTCAR
jgi:tellurite resistance protein TehA-like permease